MYLSNPRHTSSAGRFIDIWHGCSVVGTYQMHNLTWFFSSLAVLRRDAKATSLLPSFSPLVELLPDTNTGIKACDLFGPTHWDWLVKGNHNYLGKIMSGTLASDASQSTPDGIPTLMQVPATCDTECPYPQMIPDHLHVSTVSPGLIPHQWVFVRLV